MQLFRTLRRRLFAFQILLLLIGSCAVAYGALRSFETNLMPDLTRKGDLIARSLAGQMQRALDYGVAFDRLGGVEDLFRSIRAANPEILFITATATDGDGEGGHAFHAGEAEKGSVLKILLETLPAGDGRETRGAVPAAGFLIVSRPITVADQPVGWIHVGVDANFVQQQLSEIFYDILVVLVVSLLLTFELLLLIMANASAPLQALQSVFDHAGSGDRQARLREERWPREVRHIALALGEVVAWLNDRYASLAKTASGQGQPAGAAHRLAPLAEALSALGSAAGGQDAGRGGQHGLVAIRMPLFVFFLAEELSRSFFPLYARSLSEPVAGLSPEIVISLPMMLFMLVVAFSQPFGGPWAQRLGARRLLIIGAVIGAAGLTLTALAQSLWALLLWRFVTAAGYGLVFVAGQSYVVVNTDPKNRAWGLAMFVGSVLAATICGPAIGGILAERIGERGTFCVGAGLALLSALLAAWLLRAPRPEQTAARVPPLRWSDVREVMANQRFFALVCLGAMPAKIILTGFLFYLAPLYLASLGNTPSATGRMMMLYGLLMVLLTPFAARLVDRIGHPVLFVVAGGLTSGVGLLGLLWSDGTMMMVAAIGILGIAQATSITPQLALVPAACRDECRRLGQVTVIGFFRLFERIGSALGPLIAGALLEPLGYVATMVAMGIGMAIASLLLGLVWNSSERQPKGSVPALPGE